MKKMKLKKDLIKRIREETNNMSRRPSKNKGDTK
jgi:hypothetical protein